MTGFAFWDSYKISFLKRFNQVTREQSLIKDTNWQTSCLYVFGFEFEYIDFAIQECQVPKLKDFNYGILGVLILSP